MTVHDVIESLGADVAAEGDTTRLVTSGYTCDLLSEVIAKAAPGSAWVTIQTHVNVIAVAAMVGISVVIVCEGRTCESDAVSYTHLRAHETRHDLVCRLLLEKKK